MTDCIFTKMMQSPGMLCALSTPVTEATDGLKILLGPIVKCSCFEVPG